MLRLHFLFVPNTRIAVAIRVCECISNRRLLHNLAVVRSFKFTYEDHVDRQVLHEGKLVEGASHVEDEGQGDPSQKRNFLVGLCNHHHRSWID